MIANELTSANHSFQVQEVKHWNAPMDLCKSNICSLMGLGHAILGNFITDQIVIEFFFFCILLIVIEFN